MLHCWAPVFITFIWITLIKTQTYHPCAIMMSTYIDQIFQKLYNFQSITAVCKRTGKEIQSSARWISIQEVFHKLKKEILKIVYIFHSMKQKNLGKIKFIWKFMLKYAENLIYTFLQISNFIINLNGTSFLFLLKVWLLLCSIILTLITSNSNKTLN